MLKYLTRNLSKNERRTAERYMRQYRNLETIIESKKLNLTEIQAVSFDDEPSKTNKFHSDTETKAIQRLDIEKYKDVKRLLDMAYQSVNQRQKLIWDEHYIDGRFDIDIYYGHNIPKRTYYREKNELIRVVAECLRVGTNLHQ